MALTVVTYLWGEKYSLDDVRKLEAGLRRGMKEPYRFAVVTDNVDRAPDLPMWEIPQEDIPLTKMQGCFARLRLFDPEWLAGHGIAEGERIVSLDLVPRESPTQGEIYALHAAVNIVHCADDKNVLRHLEVPVGLLFLQRGILCQYSANFSPILQCVEEFTEHS